MIDYELLDSRSHNFPGGTCTAYLTLTGVVRAVHTITRLSGSFIRSEPVVVTEAQQSATLARMCKAVPLH